MQTLSAVCAISFVLLTLTFHEGSALKCWRCSSDSRGGEFCRDPFDPEKLSEKDLQWSFIECKEPAEYEKVAVCKKIIQNIRDKVVVKRSCAVEALDRVGEDCRSQDTPSFVKTVFCQTCVTDGCNGQISTDYESLADDFPPGELTQFIHKEQEPQEDPKLQIEDDEEEVDEEEEEGDDDEDNNIAKDAARRGNLVTRPEVQTEKAVPVPVEVSKEQPNSGALRSIWSVVSMISLALFVKNLWH